MLRHPFERDSVVEDLTADSVTADSVAADTVTADYMSSTGDALVGDDLDVSGDLDVANAAVIGGGLTALGHATANPVEVSFTHTAVAADRKGVNIVQAGSLNATAAARESHGVRAVVSTSRSSGANALTNVAVYANASGGQNNYSGFFDAGLFRVNGAATFASEVTHPDIATPAAPADGVSVFSSEIAGRSMLSTIDSGGIDVPLQTSMAHRSIGLWASNPNTTTWNISGIAPAVTTASGGTATLRTQDQVSFATSQGRTATVSGAAAGNVASLRGSNSGPKVWRGNAARLGGFYHVYRFNVSDAALVATANMFAGISTNSSVTDVAPSTLVNQIGIGCDSGDTELQLYAAGAVAQARTSLGASFPVNTTNVDVYELTLFAVPNGSVVGWRVLRVNTGNVASGTVSVAANLPSSTAVLFPIFWRSNGGTASAVALDIHLAYFGAQY